MRIRSVSGTVYRQRILHRACIGAAFQAARPFHTTLLVRVEADSGLVGYGEGFGHYSTAPVTRSALETIVAPRCVGVELSDAPLAAHIAEELAGCSASGPLAYALSGLDIALWDLRGKAVGRPVHALLGGAKAASVPAYASLTRYADPAVVRAECEVAVQRGYGAIKLHEIRLDEIDAGAEVCRAAGIPLMVDANCPWTLHEASRICRSLAGQDASGRRPLQLHWLEEPVWPPESYAAMRVLKQRFGVAIAAGECAPSITDLERMVEGGAVDFVQPSVTKLGGITGMRRVIEHARARGVAIAPHSPYYGPGLVATLHLCAALLPDAFVEHLFFDLQTGPLGATVVPERGHFVVPTAAGLGFEPDLECLQALAVA